MKTWGKSIVVGGLLAVAAGAGIGWWSVLRERAWMASARAAEKEVDPTRIDGAGYADLTELRRRFDTGEPVDGEKLSRLGYFYKNLWPRTREDDEVVFRIFRHLAESGNVYAMCELANLYLRGQGTVTNDAESAAWYQKAHAATNYFGTCGLAGAYRNGRGVAIDIPRAVELYKEAERHGVGGAAYELGEIYEQGLLGKADIAEAIRWHKRSLQAKNNGFGHREKSEAALKRLEKKVAQGR